MADQYARECEICGKAWHFNQSYFIEVSVGHYVFIKPEVRMCVQGKKGCLSCSTVDTTGQDSLFVGGNVKKPQSRVDVLYPLNLNLYFMARTFCTAEIRSTYSLRDLNKVEILLFT